MLSPCSFWSSVQNSVESTWYSVIQDRCEQPESSWPRTILDSAFHTCLQIWIQLHPTPLQPSNWKDTDFSENLYNYRLQILQLKLSSLNHTQWSCKLDLKDCFLYKKIFCMNFTARLCPKGTHGVEVAVQVSACHMHEPHALYAAPIFHLKKILPWPSTVVFHAILVFAWPNRFIWVVVSSRHLGVVIHQLCCLKKIKSGQIQRRQIISQASTPIKCVFHFHMIYCRCLKGLLLAVSLPVHVIPWICSLAEAVRGMQQRSTGPSPDVCSEHTCRDVMVLQPFMGPVKRKHNLEDMGKGLPRTKHWSN